MLINDQKMPMTPELFCYVWCSHPHYSSYCHCELPPGWERNTSTTGLSSNGSSVSSFLAPELRRGEGMGNGGQAPKKRRCCSWDKEVKEPSLFSLRHKEVKSDVSLSTSETKTWWRRSLWSIRGRCSKIKSWKTEIQGRRSVGVLTKWVGVTWYTSWRAVDSCPITRNFQIWTVYLGSSFVTSTLPEEVFMWSCIKEQSDWKITKISPGLKPVFTVAVYSFLICFCQWSSWDTLCHLVQTFWTQHFETPPSAPHLAGMLVNQTGSHPSPVSPGDIFSVVANKKWALAQITVVYTKLFPPLFLFFTSCKNKVSPHHCTAVHSTNFFSHTLRSSPLKSLAVELKHDNCHASNISDVSHMGAQGQTGI